MKTIATITLLLLLTVATGYAQKPKDKNGPVLTAERTLEPFHGIAVGGAFEVSLTQGSTQSIKLVADENAMPSIVTEVKDGILHIYLNKTVKRVKQLRASITVTDLKMLDISGAADVKSTNLLKSDQLRIGISGAASTELEVEARSIIGDISGAGNCGLIGSTYELRLIISGAGNFNAVDLKAQMVDIEVSGAGSARINSKDELKAVVSGAGSVNYLGSPSIKEIDVSGAGSVRSLK